MVKQQYIECGRCQGLCFGDVVRAYGQYFHIKCFSCEVAGCSQDLLNDGYFVAKGTIYCRKDYHKLMGRRCAGCKKYVEGEVISALDNLYHATCFRCHLCNYVFPPNTQICYDGNHLYCDTCNSPATTNKRKTTTITTSTENGDDKTPAIKICVGCHLEIKTGQALMAGEKPYHLWCFKCMQCNVLLTGDYMAHEEEPYCEPCYHNNFGVVCDQCNGFITGKVLQAGEKCYHPRCSKCAMCGEMFNEGEEMFLQGSQIWHPRCNKDAMRHLGIATREQRSERTNGSVMRREYDSDASSDSTAPPPTENYDASRSYNESSEMVDPEILPTFPKMMTNVFELPDSRRSDNHLANKVSSSPRKEPRDIPRGYSGELVIDVNRSRNSPTKDDEKKDFYRYLMKNDHHHLDRMFQDQLAFSRHMTSPSNVTNSPRSLGSPGSFRSVHSSSGFHSANSPNGYHSSNSQNAFRSANSSKCFLPPKLNGNYKPDSTNSATNVVRSPRGIKQRGCPPPYESVVSESSPPPIPPPPTRASSQKWRQKHDCATFSTPSEETSLTKAQQLQLRRLSFSKAVSTATDESRHNTLTDYSDTFTSSLTSSSDGFDESGDKPSSYSRYREKGSDNVLTTYA